MPTVTLTTTGVFSGYTLSELRALVLRMLRVSDTTRFSPTSGTADYDWIDDALNRGQEDFVRLTKCLKTYAIIEMGANQRVYRLPEDCIDIIAAYYYDSDLSEGYRQLAITTIEELNSDVSDWRTVAGDPKRIYIDRNYGAGVVFGVYPIPDTAGDTITFDSEYGVLVEWICPLYTYNQDLGTIIKITGNDEYILPTQSGVSVDVTPSNGNILMEYARLPQVLVEQGGISTKYTEIPKEYQKSLAYYAAADLLSNNPEDSAEYKRSNDMSVKFMNEVQIYLGKRKKPMSGQRVRIIPNAWNYVQNMQYYKEQP